MITQQPKQKQHKKDYKMTETITMPKNFNGEKITYVGPKVNKYKAKSVYIKYGSKSPLIFKTPIMNCPFGVSTYTTEGESSYTKYSLECSFQGMDNEDKHGNELKCFYNALTNLDTKLVDDACKNSPKHGLLKEDVSRGSTKLLSTEYSLFNR